MHEDDDGSVMYRLVIARWTDKQSTTQGKWTNITRAEVMQRAKELGYTEPKWYQFWKLPICIVGEFA